MLKLQVSVVFALPNKQYLFETMMARGSTAAELIHSSGFIKDVPELANKSVSELIVGVYSQGVDGDYLLEQGDRLEIYRPLNADPKEVRRQLALLGKTMGKK